MIVYSHRGIDIDRTEKLSENSLAAFRYAAAQGFGIELDLQMTKDQGLLVAHDSNTARWSGGRANHDWSSLSNAEVLKLEAEYGPVARLPQILALAEEFSALHLAIHLKGTNQSQIFIQELTKSLAPAENIFDRILIFDVSIETGAALGRAFPGIGLAPSVAHDYDITRYQALAHGTLYSLDQVLTQRHIFNWLWLDEWDRRALHNQAKELYSKENFEEIRRRGFKIAVISPELHKAEGHQDGENEGALKTRWKAILDLQPDAICTDYPARLLESLKTS